MAHLFQFGSFPPSVIRKLPLGTFTTATTVCLSTKPVWTAFRIHTELVCMLLEYKQVFLHQPIPKAELQLSSLE